MNNKVSTFVGLKMPIDLNKRLEALARAENNSKSSIVRRILTAGLRREEDERRAS